VSGPLKRYPDVSITDFVCAALGYCVGVRPRLQYRTLLNSYEFVPRAVTSESKSDRRAPSAYC